MKDEEKANQNIRNAAWDLWQLLQDRQDSHLGDLLPYNAIERVQELAHKVTDNVAVLVYLSEKAEEE